MVVIAVAVGTGGMEDLGDTVLCTLWEGVLDWFEIGLIVLIYFIVVPKLLKNIKEICNTYIIFMQNLILVYSILFFLFSKLIYFFIEAKNNVKRFTPLLLTLKNKKII